MHVLFVCTSNRLRSPTAETLFRELPGLEVSSAGLDPAATRVVDESMIGAADAIFVLSGGDPAGNPRRRSRDQTWSCAVQYPRL